MIQRAGWLVAVLMALAGAPGRAQTGPEGLWLISPDSFDDLVEAGVVLSHYPVLAIDPGGTFRLQFVTMACHALAPDGRMLTAGENAECEREAVALRPELGGALGYRTLSGQWGVDGRTLRFRAEQTGRIPVEEVQRMLRTPLADLPASRRTNFRRMAETFHTTWFLGNGTPVQWQRSAVRLTLMAPAGGPPIVHWDPANPAQLAAAALAVQALEVSGVAYFRCLAGGARRAQQGRDPHQLLALADPALRLRAAYAQLEGMAARDPREASVTQSLQAARAEVAAHPLLAAVVGGKLGVALGCPERDR
jgi:hypothetical protein